VTLAALDAFLQTRGKGSGETVLLRALEALQGERYLRLAERRPGNYILDKTWPTIRHLGRQAGTLKLRLRAR
jgi:hypothetical protein